jgi:hypothetical protein
MSHGTDPGLRDEGRPTPGDSVPRRLLGRLATHFVEWSDRYVRMRLDAVDADR